MDSVLFIIKSATHNTEIAKEQYMPPLGVMSICTVLRMNGYNAQIIDQSINPLSASEIIETIKEMNPLYVGISVYTENVDESLHFCRFLKRQIPKLKIALGGPHPSLDTEYCLRDRYVDFIVRGEGEGANLELAEAIRTNQELIAYEDIEGLVYRLDRKKFQWNEARKRIDYLDFIPIVNRFIIEGALQSVFVTISSSRGCPGKCIYCAAPTMSGNKYRIRDIENVFMESLYLLALTNEKMLVYYIDDTFTAIPSRVNRYLDMVECGNVKFKWRCESRVDVMLGHRDMLFRMSQLGCVHMQYGIESGNQDVLNKIHKHLELSKLESLVDFTVNDCKIYLTMSFIFGHYCDTEDTMNDTLTYIEKIKKRFQNKLVVFYSYNTPYPGTYQYIHHDEIGLKFKFDKFSELDMLHPVAETDNFTTKTLLEFGKKADSVSHH